jgi:hypothetical protein
VKFQFSCALFAANHISKITENSEKINFAFLCNGCLFLQNYTQLFMNRIVFPLVILISIFLEACQTSRQEPDLDGIEIHLDIMRFEQDIFAIQFDSISIALPRLKNTYGEFFDMFNYRIAGLGSDNDPQYPAYLKAYMTDYSVNELYNTCREKYPDVEFLKTGLEQAFRNYRYYFPGNHVPKVITFISGLNQSIVTSDTILAIALDKYLGSDCELYKRAMIPQYLSYSMRREKIFVDCMRGWGMTEFEEGKTENTLLSKMLYQAKILYFTKHMLPGEPDSLIFGFTGNQIEWCRKNEERMWSYLVGKKLLFSSDQLMIIKFINEAPYTKDFARESPGRAVTWLGMQVIAAYMDSYPDISLDSLMHNSDYRAILENSRYEP